MAETRNKRIERELAAERRRNAQRYWTNKEQADDAPVRQHRSGRPDESRVEASVTNFAWLIEAPGPNYLGTHGIGHNPRFFWTRDPNRATRFYSKEQADGVMMAVRELDPSLWAFAANLGEAWPVEHGWIYPLNDGDAKLSSTNGEDEVSRTPTNTLTVEPTDG